MTVSWALSRPSNNYETPISATNKGFQAAAIKTCSATTMSLFNKWTDEFQGICNPSPHRKITHTNLTKRMTSDVRWCYHLLFKWFIRLLYQMLFEFMRNRAWDKNIEREKPSQQNNSVSILCLWSYHIYLGDRWHPMYLIQVSI